MGKGDKKSKKGKLWRGSYGISRNKNKIKSRIKNAAVKRAGTPKPETEAKAAKPRKTARKKAETKE
jgi:30S ribosomal protein S31